MNDAKIDLKELFLSRQSELMSKHAVIKRAFDHPTMAGNANERAWVDLLIDFLPMRYQVASGKVVDSTGHVSDQIDVIIFDQYFSPIIFKDYEQCIVPAESVYCVFEVKPNLNKEHVEYAAKKAASVRRLARTAVKIPVAGDGLKDTKLVEISAGLICTRSDWVPAYGKPFSSLLATLDADARLDLGCTLDAGAFYTDMTGGNLANSDKEVGLMAFLSTLMLKLQSKGTAGAIDYRAYGAHSLGI